MKTTPSTTTELHDQTEQDAGTTVSSSKSYTRQWALILICCSCTFAEIHRWSPNVMPEVQRAVQSSSSMNVGCSPSHNNNLSYTSPRLSQTGSWMGHSWIPPKQWHLLDATEFQDLFRDKSVLWLGDSTGRRAAMTLYSILNDTTLPQTATPAISVETLDARHVIDVNRRQHTEHCQRAPFSAHNDIYPSSICRSAPSNPTKDYVWLGQNCLAQTEEFLQKELNNTWNMTQNVDIMIVALGVWQNVRAGDCRRVDAQKRRLPQLVKDTIQLLIQFQEQRPDMTILWRTSGFSKTGNNNVIFNMNNLVMDEIDHYQEHAKNNLNNKLRYVHWAGAMEPRSFQAERIDGDIIHHYGLQPRLVLAQMIANAIQDINKNDANDDNKVECTPAETRQE